MLEAAQPSVVKAEPGIELAFEIPFGADAPTVFGPFSKLSVLATSVQRQIKPGIYLQRFGAAFAKAARARRSAPRPASPPARASR